MPKKITMLCIQKLQKMFSLRYHTEIQRLGVNPDRMAHYETFPSGPTQFTNSTTSAFDAFRVMPRLLSVQDVTDSH